MTRLQLEQITTRAAFFIPGWIIAGWAPLVPYAKSRLAISDATLGLVLLCLGAGSLVAMPFAGTLAARYGCRAVLLICIAAMLPALPLLALAPSSLTLGAALFVLGASIGTMDCVLNIQAVAVEQEAGRPLMSNFHAFYSIGLLCGAATMTALLGSTRAPFVSTLLLVAVCVAITAASAHGWRTGRVVSGGSPFAIPKGAVLWLGIVCFVGYLVEGSMLDWSAVFLHEGRGIAMAQAGLGFVAFNIAMTVARFFGDHAVARLGRAAAVLGGGVIAAAGLALATSTFHVPLALTGFALVGIGCSNIVPVMFTLAGQQPQTGHSAIAAVTLMGYAGLLSGPAIIGFVAEASSLHLALVLSGLTLAAASMLGAGVASGQRRIAPPAG